MSQDAISRASIIAPHGFNLLPKANISKVTLAPIIGSAFILASTS